MDINSLRFDNLLNKLVSNFQKPQDGVLTSFQDLVIPFVLTISAFVVLMLVRRIFSIKKSVNEASMLLELTPPSFTEKQSYTTDQLFSIIHALGNQKLLKDRLLGSQTMFSLEIVSTQNQGIRYLVRTSPKQVNTLKKNLLSYLPNLKVKTVNEYLPDNTEVLNKHFYKIIEFKLTKHFAFSLKRQSELEIHDPIHILQE